MAVFKRGNDYFVDYYFMGRRQRKRIGPNKSQAHTVLNKIKVQIAENRFLDVQKESTMSFREMVDLFIETYAKPNKRSWKCDDYILKRFITYFGEVRLARITRQMVEEFKARRLANVTGSRINRELICLKTLFNKAISWGKLSQNPLKGVKLFKEEASRTRYLEKGEWDALQKSCPAWLLPIVQVAFHTGMRQGEIIHLCWDNIDFERKQIHVRFSKSGTGRYIPINETLESVLKAVKPQPDSVYVFPDKDGKPFTRFGSFRGAFQKAIENAGITDFHFHDLRHTFASHLTMAGVDLRTVGEILGHRSGFKMTMRYSHLSPQHQLDAVKRLDGKFGAAVGPRLDSGPSPGPKGEFDKVALNAEGELLSAKSGMWRNGRRTGLKKRIAPKLEIIDARVIALIPRLFGNSAN